MASHRSNNYGMWIYGFSTKIVSQHKSISSGGTMIYVHHNSDEALPTWCVAFVVGFDLPKDHITVCLK